MNAVPFDAVALRMHSVPAMCCKSIRNLLHLVLTNSDIHLMLNLHIVYVQTMTWDDHDIFDGWGSYPDTIQNCPVFQGCFHAAKRFYLLFQQHTTAERASQDTDLFGHR